MSVWREQGCVFPRPEPKNLRKTAFFSFPNFFPLCPPLRGKTFSHSGKTASFWGGTRKYHPRVVHVLHSVQVYDSLQAFAQSFLVIFTYHSSCSSLYRITDLLSRIKHRNRSIFYHDVNCGRPIFSGRKTPDPSLTQTNPNECKCEIARDRERQPSTN